MLISLIYKKQLYLDNQPKRVFIYLILDQDIDIALIVRDKNNQIEKIEATTKLPENILDFLLRDSFIRGEKDEV